MPDFDVYDDPPGFDFDVHFDDNVNVHNPSDFQLFYRRIVGCDSNNRRQLQID